MSTKAAPTRTDWKVFEMTKRLSSAGKCKALEYILKLIDREAKAEIIERSMEGKQ